jgi:uncharacterized membrane protein YidH (DUF202 family)
MVRKKTRINYEKERTLLAEEMTILSKERTILSFMRTGLAFIGVGIIIINVIKDPYPSHIIGWALILIGFVEVLESYRRLNKYKKKMKAIKSKI